LHRALAHSHLWVMVVYPTSALPLGHLGRCHWGRVLVLYYLLSGKQHVFRLRRALSLMPANLEVFMYHFVNHLTLVRPLLNEREKAIAKSLESSLKSLREAKKDELQRLIELLRK